MLRKKDVILIAVVLAVAAILYGVSVLTRRGEALSGSVEVYADGVLMASASLSEDVELRVEQENGALNIVTVENGVAYMKFSSCDNQLCVQQGEISGENWTQRAMGRSIICLPNHVVVELALEEGHPTLEDYDVPDV